LGGSFVSATTKTVNQPSAAVAESSSNNSSSKAQPDEGIWSWLAHDAVGFFTLCLFLAGSAQVVLFLWQLWLIRESLDDAKVAAEAAKESADAAKVGAAASRESADTAKFSMIAS